MHFRRSRLAAVALLALPVLAGHLQTGTPRAYADAPTCTAPTAQAQVDVAARAMELMLDRFETPLSSAALVQAGWDQLAREAPGAGAPPPTAISPTDERDQDDATLRSSLGEYVAAVACDAPSGWVPAHAVVRGMATSVHERHTYFVDPRGYQEYLDWASSRVHYGGIGARFEGPGLVVLEVFDDTPAARAGLRPGDEILEVDQVSVAGKPPAEGVKLLRGPVGSAVALVIRRRGETAPVALRVEREDVRIDFVVARQLPDDVAYVRLRGFPEPGVADAVEAAVAAFAEQGARGLVLDLRGNAGGRLDVGARLLNMFLPPGTSLFEQIDRAGNHQTRSASAEPEFALPLVVLVDGETASMGELFAAAVQEHGIATVIGTTTAGSVAGGLLFPLGDGSALNVTAFEVRSSSGAILNGTGLTPDETVLGDPATSPTGTDPVLDRALALLHEDNPEAAAQARRPITATPQNSFGRTVTSTYAN